MIFGNSKKQNRGYMQQGTDASYGAQAAGAQGGVSGYGYSAAQRGGNMPQQQREMDIDARNAEVDAQATEFARKNPAFDMITEVQNPEFVKYVWGHNLSVEDAYILAHKDELIGGGMMNAQQSNFHQGGMPQNAQTAPRRIIENGADKSSAASLRKNPNDLSDDELKEILKRVERGEKISF